MQQQARELEEAARLEDITVWEDCIVKQTKKGEKNMGAGWQAGRLRKVYLGSCKKLSRAGALQKARKTKAEALGIRF